MKKLIFFTILIYFLPFRLVGFEIKNFADEDSVTIQALSKYLIDNQIIKNDTSKCLFIFYFPDRIPNSVHFEINSFSHEQSIDFKNDLEFSFIDKSTQKELFDGFVIRDRILFNTISYMNYSMPSFEQQFLKEHFEKIKVNFPKLKDLKLDIDNFVVINNRGKIKGSINIVYRNKDIDCYFPETKYVIDNKHYSEFFDNGVFGYEPAFIYWCNHPKKYLKKGVYIGNEYYMFDSYHRLIHHGVSSERLLF